MEVGTESRTERKVRTDEGKEQSGERDFGAEATNHGED